MARDNTHTAQGPFRIETVRGEPYQVGERTLIPVTRLVSVGKARATIGSNSLNGRGGALVQIIPVALLEETDEGERHIAITDATSTILRTILVAAMAITLVFATIRWLARRLPGANARR